MPNVCSLLYFTSDKCNMLQSDCDELESEHERLTARHSKLIQDIDNKEAHWKDRFVFKLKNGRVFNLSVNTTQSDRNPRECSIAFI